MIRTTMAILLALLLVITTGAISGAEMAKEGSGDYRSGKTGTFTFIAMGKERGQMNFEELGVVVTAPENSPFHNATFRDIGTMHFIKGKSKGSGMVEYTCVNGDKIYATFESQGVTGGPSSSVLTLVGGTGACTGITGTIELRGTPGIKTSKKGTWQTISVGTLSWKIP